MGFSTGFTGGVTLTLGIAYLTVISHQHNRRAQAENLRLQSRVLNGILDPTPLPPPRSRAELAREERGSIIESAKDRWNDEVESAVRRLQETDWAGIQEGMEGAVARLLGKGLEKGREGVEEVEKNAKPLVQEAVDRSKAAAGRGKDEAGRIAGEVKDLAKKKADRAGSDIKIAKDDIAESVRHGGGTIDAARGAVRGAVARGIEKGRDAVGRAKAVVGLAEEKMESRAQSKIISHSSDVEKALHERFDQPGPIEKTPEQLLEERYIPMDKKDDTHLKGL